MKETEAGDEHFFRKIMAESKLELPFSDFDDNVMLQIEKKVVRQQSISKDLKLSWISFVAGSGFGIGISLILPRLQHPIFGIQPGTVAVIFQLTFVVLLFTQLETLIRLVKRFESKT